MSKFNWDNFFSLLEVVHDIDTTDSEVEEIVTPTQKWKAKIQTKDKPKKAKIVNTPITDLATWLEAGKKPQKEPNSGVYTSLYARQLGGKISIQINKNNENQKWYLDIRNWADSDQYSRGAFLPMEHLPRLLAELNDIPSQLLTLFYNFKWKHFF